MNIVHMIPTDRVTHIASTIRASSSTRSIRTKHCTNMASS